MGSVYRKNTVWCVTCKKRPLRAERATCKAAGHTLDKRASNVWWIQYRRGLRVFDESSRSERKRDAEDLLARRMGDLANGKKVTPQMARTTIDELIDDLLNHFRANRKKSLGVVERRLTKHVKPFFTGVRACDITTADIQKFTVLRQTTPSVTVLLPDGTRHRRPAADSEINRELALLKQTLRFSKRTGRLMGDIPYVPMLQENNVRTGFFEPEQYASVLRHLPEPVRPVIAFGYITGWRVHSEVLPLEWRQVDMKAGEVRLDPGTTKNGDGRVFPFTRELRTVMEGQWAEHDRLKKAGHICPYVFFREVAEGRGGELKPHRIVAFTKAWKSACRAAGCPGRIPHDLRRTAVRNLVRAGVPQTIAMKLTGHKTDSVFRRYDIVSAADLRVAVERLDAASV